MPKCYVVVEFQNICWYIPQTDFMQSSSVAWGSFVAVYFIVWNNFMIVCINCKLDRNDYERTSQRNNFTSHSNLTRKLLFLCLCNFALVCCQNVWYKTFVSQSWHRSVASGLNQDEYLGIKEPSYLIFISSD